MRRCSAIRTMFRRCFLAAMLLCCQASRAELVQESSAPLPRTAGNAPSSVSTNSSALSTPARPSASNLVWGLHWDNGLEYELGSSGRIRRLKARHPDSDVEPYHGKIGGKLHVDAADYQTETGVKDIPDEAGIRRARLYTTGSFFLAFPVFYKAEVEVAEDDFYVRETYLSLANVPCLQTVKVGYFKAPMTMEGYMGSGDTFFLERASPVEAFGPGIMYGIQPTGVSADKRMTWAAGWFADGGQNDVSEASRSPTRGIGRMTWLPVYEDSPGNAKLVHLGVSGQFMYSAQSDVQYRSRPESYFAPRLVDTGPLNARESITMGIEFAAENGPLSLQSEFLQASVYGQEEADSIFRGCYVAGSWLLTGENRPYNRSIGAFGRVTPRNPLSWQDRAFGAWELVARFSHLDLDDQGVEGGTMDLVTLGVNNYVTSRIKLMLDCAVGHVDHGEDEGNLRIVEGRVQYEF